MAERVSSPSRDAWADHDVRGGHLSVYPGKAMDGIAATAEINRGRRRRRELLHDWQQLELGLGTGCDTERARHFPRWTPTTFGRYQRAVHDHDRDRLITKPRTSARTQRGRCLPDTGFGVELEDGAVKRWPGVGIITHPWQWVGFRRKLGLPNRRESPSQSGGSIASMASERSGRAATPSYRHRIHACEGPQ